jgi:uncharacterized membrane protein
MLTRWWDRVTGHGSGVVPRAAQKPYVPGVVGGAVLTIIAGLWALLVSDYAGSVIPSSEDPGGFCHGGGTRDDARFIYWVGGLTIGVVVSILAYRGHRKRAAVAYGLTTLVVLIGIIPGLPILSAVGYSSECGG